ncbi:alpha/beta hydrolase [Pseudomonas sp. BN415]|uniref:alpha/beta fold hydrolase n=1 Tax=Pseudomonas sp. BN415 TaxID=2567889 RepID=UPI002457A97C|nr:alpha/beta hydrolase [Pseudomonas sp. BN415]
MKLKRVVTLAAAVLTSVVAAFYLAPALWKPPLVELNRKMAGLSERAVSVDSHEVRYLEGGKGEVVVLLHGIFGEKDHWVDFARQLTPRYRVIVPDLPGFGGSSRLAGESYGYAAQMQRLVMLLERLDLKRVHIAGNSMGGTLAALLAMREPRRVASVAFIGAPHGIRTPRRSQMDSAIESGESPLIARDAAAFERMLALLFEQRPYLPYPILHAARADAIGSATSNQRLWNEQLKDRYLLDEHIGELRAPALVLWGEADRLFDASGAWALRARLKHAQVKLLPGIGHLPMMEAPKLTARVYGAFLERLRAPSAESATLGSGRSYAQR